MAKNETDIIANLSKYIKTDEPNPYLKTIVSAEDITPRYPSVGELPRFDLSKQSTYDTSIIDFTSKGGKAPKAQGEFGLWTLLNVLTSAGGAITNQIANWTDKELNWKDIPFAEIPGMAAKAQMNAWKDGVFDLRDVPILGGIAGVGSQTKKGEDVIQNLGLKDTKGKIDATEVLGFGLDVALDPLTYFTLGGSSAVKFGLKASREAAEVVTKNLADEGIPLLQNISGKGKNIIESTRNTVFDATDIKLKDDYAKQQGFKNFDEFTQNVDISQPQFVDDLRKITEQATYKANEAANFVDNAGKAARAANQNNFINLDVPFTTISKGFGSKPKAWLKLERKIGQSGRTAIINQFRRLNIVDPADVDGIIKKLYDVDTLENMNLQQVRHFAQTLSKLNNNIYEQAVETLAKSGISPSAANAIQEVLIRTRRGTGIGNDIGAILRDPEKGISQDALVFSSNELESVLTSSLISTITNTLGNVNIPNTVLQDMLNLENQIISNGTLNLSRIVKETPEVIRDYLQRNGVATDQIDNVIKQFETDVQITIGNAKAKLLQDIQPAIDQVQGIVDNYTKMFKDVMSGKADETIKEFEGQIKNLQDLLNDPQGGFKKLIDDNKSSFAVTSGFAVRAEQIHEKYKDIWDIDVMSLKSKEEARKVIKMQNDAMDEMTNHIQYYFEFQNFIVGAVKNGQQHSELFKNMKSVYNDLDILSRLGFYKGKFSNLDIEIQPYRLKINGNDEALAYYSPTEVKIVVGKDGQYSFIHEFMHYIEDQFLPSKKDYGKYKNIAVSKTTRGYKDFYPGHPLYDLAKDIRKITTAYDNPIWSNTSRITKNQVYYESNTENIARFFEQVVVNRFNKDMGYFMTDELMEKYAKKQANTYASGNAKYDVIKDDATADKVFDELMDRIKKLGFAVSKDVIESDLLAKGFTPLGSIDDLTAKLDNLTNQLDNYKQATNKIQKELIDTNKFQQDMVIRRMSKSKYFNPESLGSADDFVESYGKLITRSNSIVYGEKVRMQKDLRMMEKLIKGLSQDELATIPYLLEKKYPGGMTREQFLASRNIAGDTITRLDEVASKMENIFNKLGILEMEVGAMTRLRQDYFPHVYKIPDADAVEQLDELAKQFPEDELIKELAGRSKNLGFDKVRKSFQTLADLDDHLAKLQKMFNEAATTEEKARIMTRIKRLSDIYERNPINALARRYAKSIRSRVNTELYSEFEKASLLIRKDSSALLDYDIKAFHRLDKTEAAALGLREGDLMHKEVFEGLKKVDGLFKDEGLNKVIKEVDSVVSIWKQVLTSLVPKYYFYNFIGNIYNNSLAGVSISSYKQAGDIMKRIRTGELTTPDKQFLDQAIKDGVINQGFLADLSQYFGDLDKLNPPTVGQKFERAMGQRLKNVPVIGTERLSYKRTLESVGEFTDDFTRLANYIDALNKTGSREIASDQVRKYLFNYRELSVGDRYIRQFVPFWSWMRNNIPLQLNKLFTEPRHALTWYKIKQQTQGEITDSDIPRWILESSFFIGDKAIDPRLPISDLNQIIRTDVDGFGRELFSMTNPLLKNIIELSLNKKFFNERPINYGENPVEDYTAYFLQQFGQYGSSTANILFKENVSIPEELAKLFLPIPREVPGR